MNLAGHIEALMGHLTPRDFEPLAPAERRRFADLARRVAELAEPRAELPKGGFFAEMRDGRGSQ
jgi:hypothetical protein